MALLSVAGMTYMSSASNAVQMSKRKALDVQMTQLCDAGVQTLVRTYWRDFRDTQAFDDMTTAFTGASVANPKAVTSGTLPGVGAFSVAVIGFATPASDSYSRTVTVRSVGYIDRNSNGVLDTNEPAKIVDVKVTFQLQRSPVFDYVYFVNNFGWMSGFGPTDLVMRLRTKNWVLVLPVRSLEHQLSGQIPLMLLIKAGTTHSSRGCVKLMTRLYMERNHQLSISLGKISYLNLREVY